LRLKKDVRIKGQLAYAELTLAGLLYISRPDPATNAEVNVIDLASGEPKFKDAIESGKPWGGNPDDYNAARYSLHHTVEGTTLNAVRAGLYGAAASAYGDAFAQASRNATDSTARRITGQLATAYTQGGAQLQGYASQSAALATKRFKASLAVPGSVFMLTRAPEGNGNVLLQIDKDSAQPRARVDLGKEREPVYAVDDVAGMLFLRTATGTLVGYRLRS